MADATKTLEIIIAARDEATKVITGFQSKFQGLMNDIRPGAIALAGLGAATGLVAKGLVDAAGKMEATRTSFRVLVGDSKLAEKTLKDLFDLETKTPFTLESVLTESKKLLAMGTRAEDLTKTLSTLGDVAAGVGFEKLPQLTLAFGQIQARGRLMGTELRQLTEAGFNLADAMGVSSQKLDEMIANKEVGFEQVRAAFEKVTSEGGRFNGMMEQLSQTTPGRLSTLESSVFKLQAALGTALLPAVNNLINAIIPLMEQFALWATNNQQLVTILVGAGLVLGLLGSAILILGPIVSGIGVLFTMFGGAVNFVISIVGGMIAILGGPLTIAIVAIMALVGVLAVAWKNNWGGIRDKVHEVVEWFKNTALPSIKSFFDSLQDKVTTFVGWWIDKWNAAKSVVEGVANAIRNVISAAENLAKRVAGGLKIPGFQHGGFVPGSYGEAVPAILHGGERVIPRTGVDVNQGGGDGISLSINFSGPISMDSDERVRELGNRILSMINRQNELATRGVSI